MAESSSLPVEAASPSRALCEGSSSSSRAPRRLVAAIVQHPLRTLLVAGVIVGLTIGGYVGGRHLWAWHHLREAKEAADRHDFQQAHSRITRSLQVWPRDASMRFLAARYARRADQMRDADEHLRICQDLEGVTRLNGLESSLLRAQQGRLTEVENALQARVMNQDPESALILEALAKGYIVVYRLNDAMIALYQLLELEPDHAAGHIMRGRILNAADRTMDALADLRRAVDLCPNRDDWRKELAELLLEHHFPNEALPLLQDLRARHDEPELLFDLARAWRQNGEAEEARRVLGELVAAHPGHADAVAEMGQLEKEDGHAEAAEPLLRKAFQLDPTSYHIGYSLYECLGILGKQEEARALLEQLLERKAALRRVQRIALELAKVGKSPVLRHEAGTICLRLSLDEEGVRWLLSALEDDPNHAPTHGALADYFESRNLPEQAAQHRRRAAR